MNNGVFDNWDNLLEQRQVELPSPPLAHAIAFIERTWSPHGWGVLPNTNYDRHSSAVAMQALQNAAQWMHLETDIVSISEFFANKYARQYPGLGTDALVDALYLSWAKRDRSSAEARALARRTGETFVQLFEEVPPDASRRVASLMLASDGLIELDELTRNRARDFLLNQRHKSGGYWSTVPTDEGSLTATAEVLRALELFDGDDVIQASRLALKFIEGRATTFLTKPQDVDTYDLAICLRALASFQQAPYDLVSPLEDELLKRQSEEDGGWPSAHQRDSVVELTGLSVLALTEAGARSHVPTRLARAIVAVAKDEVEKLESGNSQNNKKDKEDETRRRLEPELAQARKTAAQVPALQSEVEWLRRAVDPVLYERELLTGAYTDRMSGVALTVATVATIAGIGIAVAAGRSLTSRPIAIVLWVIAGICVVAGLVTIVIWRQGASRASQILRRSGIRSWGQQRTVNSTHDDHLARMRRGLESITFGWSPSARKELPYLLYDEFFNVPSDVAARRAEVVAIDLGVGSESAAEFRAWASSVGLLPEAERRVLFDMIRRALS